MTGWVTRALHHALGDLPEPRLPDPDSALRAAVVAVVLRALLAEGVPRPRQR